MQLIQQIKTAKWWKVTLLMALAVLVIISCSTSIDSIDMPDSVNAGESFTSTIHVTIQTNDSRSNTKFMVALLVPKVWNVTKNSKITFTSSITTGTQTMSAIAAGTAAPQANGSDWPTILAAKIGHGGNLLAGWEWVAFYSDKAYDVNSNDNITVTITVNTKVSSDNLSFKLGYVVANSSDGLSDAQYYASSFPGCFRVFGDGDLMDYCNPQLGTVDPLDALDNDIITLGFDAGVIDTGLSDADEVYLCLKGVTATGDTLDFCGQTDQTRLSTYALKKWRIDIWPRGFFQLTKGQELSSLVYYFTDKTGQVVVGKDGTPAVPFTYTFKCQ